MKFISRAGSHAGRGFHFQDAIGVWLAVSSWVENVSFGEVIPEGRDDYEIRKGHWHAFVQVKSRRNHLGAFPVADIANFVRQLWQRTDNCSRIPDELILILECSVTNGPIGNHTLGDHYGLRELLSLDPRWTSLAKHTQILVIPSPLEEALELISRTMPCSPLAAQIYYGELLNRITTLADANGLVKDGRFNGIAVSDVESCVRRLEPLLNITSMETALSDGYCDTVDFLTPINDSVAFYQGVDVRPGHLAAGLIVERTEMRESVISALESKGATLIVGQSGAGKSSLMWEAARACRHTVRWFEIKRGDSVDKHLFIRLARSCRASPSSPIGFVLDDIGRGLIDLWDGIVKGIDRGSGILLLGSIREEDVFLLPSRGRAIEIRPVVDEVVAERVWRKLVDQNQTSWAGWREPWLLSDKLLLEYTHILTRGNRLVHILGEQVDRRLREERDTELAVLRVTALAGAAGATVEVEQLINTLNLNREDLSRSLRRLIDEHLIVKTAEGELKGLHQLRSKVLFDLCHVDPTHSPSQTIMVAIQSASNASLESLAAYVTVNFPGDNVPLLRIFANRLERDNDPHVATSIFSGLGQAHIEITLQKWIPETQAFGLEPAQLTLAVIFAATETYKIDLPFQSSLRNSILALRTRSASDPRLTLLTLLSQSTIDSMLAGANAVQLHLLLSALVGAPIPDSVKSALGKVKPNFDTIALPEASKLLSTVFLIDPKTAMSWVGSTIGQLLERVPNEIPWTDNVVVDAAPEGRLLRSRYFNVAHSVQQDPHEDVVQLCQFLSGLDPTASVVAIDAIAADGLPSGTLDLPIASKRISRENLHPPALPDWNKRWVAAAAYLVGAESITNYLERGKKLLEQLAPVLEKFVDNVLRRKTPPPSTLERLGAIHELSRNLTPPRDSLVKGAEPEQHATPLQDVLFNSSAELLRRFVKLHESHGSFILWAGGLIKNVHLARQEPWKLIGASPDKALKRIEFVLEALRSVALDASIKNAIPLDIWLSQARNAHQNDALRVVVANVEESLQRQTRTYLQIIQSELKASHPNIVVHTRPNWVDPLPWPNLEFLLIVSLASPTEWHYWIERNGTSVKNTIGESRQIWIVPSIKGLLVSRLSVGGVSTLFPSLYEVDSWIDSLNLSRLDDRLSRAWSCVLDLIVELDGISLYKLGVDGRPFAEINLRLNDELKLDEALAYFETIADGKDVKLIPRQLSQEVASGKLALAKGIAALTHGRLDPDIVVLKGFSDELIIEDLLM